MSRQCVHHFDAAGCRMVNTHQTFLAALLLLGGLPLSACPTFAESFEVIPEQHNERAQHTGDGQQPPDAGAVPANGPADDPRKPDRTLALTLWSGALTDGNLGESLLFSEGFRSAYLGGIGVQADLLRGKRLSLLVDGNLLGHSNADPAQGLVEATIGLGRRAQLNSWLAFTVVEGMSWYSERSKQQLQEGGNGRQLVNYLAFELDARASKQLSLVGRLHHRSGIYGTMNCNTACDNNA
jgi:hypothetical protein